MSSSIIGRAAFRATRPLRAAGPTAGAGAGAGAGEVKGKNVLSKGARRDPELYVCCSPTRPLYNGMEAKRSGKLTTTSL
jgi:hypothetical protein